MNYSTKFLVTSLVALALFSKPTFAEPKASATAEKKALEAKKGPSFIDDFLLSSIYLLEKPQVVSPLDHLETSFLLTLECGQQSSIDPTEGAAIAFHESWGIHDIRAKDTGDTGVMQIKPKFAVKPENYKNYQNLFSKANSSTNVKEKAKLTSQAETAYKKLYKDLYTVEELQDPSINIHVACWALHMWKNEWGTKKSRKDYLAKYAGGNKPLKASFGFQKWVKNQVKKLEKRYAPSSTGQLAIKALALFVVNSDAHIDKFLKKEKKSLVAKVFPNSKIKITFMKKDKATTTAKVTKPDTVTVAEPLYDDFEKILKQKMKEDFDKKTIKVAQGNKQ